MSQELAVFIGNLKKDCHKKELVANLQQLFRQTIGIPVEESDVEVKNGKKSRHAFVYVQSNDELQHAIDQLETWEKRSKLRFNFSLLVDQNSALKVGLKFPDKKKDGNKAKSKRETTDYDHQKEDQILVRENRTTYNPSGNHGYNRTELQHQNGRVPPIDGQFYTEGTYLGSETRDKEFKKGEFCRDERLLGENVAKYMCAFLNSSQQGTLFMGVKDSGKVIGIEMNHETEDKARQIIDKTMNSIKPTIFPHSYHVNFIPVYDSSGQIKENFKVIEISIDKMENPGCLYQALGHVYVRRDGTVQRLEPQDIQEWDKQFHKKELQKVLEQKDAEKNIEINKVSAEKDREIQKLKKHIDEMKQEYQHLKNKKSKVCVIQ